MGTAVGPCAMQRHGLASWYLGLLAQTTPTPSRNRTQIANSFLYYIPDIDADDAFIQRTFKTLCGPMRLPTMERALVDYMRHLDVLEEFYFVEGLHEYLELYGTEELLKVAEHYGVRDEMERWIEEDKDYTNWG